MFLHIDAINYDFFKLSILIFDTNNVGMHIYTFEDMNLSHDQYTIGVGISQIVSSHSLTTGVSNLEPYKDISYLRTIVVFITELLVIHTF